VLRAFGFVTVGLAAGLMFSLTARASDDNSGTHWLRKCTNPEPGLQIECATYVRALVEYDEVRAKVLGQKRFICPDKNVTIGESREIVIKSLRDKPHELDRPFVLLAHLALEGAFPCAMHGDARGRMQ
jgi:hypothetical protein